MHTTPNTDDGAGTASAQVNTVSSGTATNVRTWAGHRQAFPLGQAHTPLTSMPTLGRALTDGSMREVDYVNTFLQHLAQHTGPADEDSDAEDAKFEEEDDDLYARDDDEDYYARRKRRTRWRPNYPKIKKTKRADGPFAAARRRASVCVPAAGLLAAGGPGSTTKKRERRSNSVSSYFAMRSAESSPSSSAPTPGAYNLSPSDSPVDARLSPVHQQATAYAAAPYPAMTTFQQPAAYHEAERLPSEWMAFHGRSSAEGDVAFPSPHAAAMPIIQQSAYPAAGLDHFQHALPQHQLYAPAGYYAAYLPTSAQSNMPLHVSLEEEEVLASSSPPIRPPQQHHYHHQQPSSHQQQQHIVLFDKPEDQPSEAQSGPLVPLQPEEEGGEWLENLLRLEQTSSSEDQQQLASPSAQHSNARHPSAAKDPFYAELFGY